MDLLRLQTSEFPESDQNHPAEEEIFKIYPIIRKTLSNQIMA